MHLKKAALAMINQSDLDPALRLMLPLWGARVQRRTVEHVELKFSEVAKDANVVVRQVVGKLQV
jgi:hypothetical protein